MKFYFLILLSLVLCSFCAYSQEAEKEKIIIPIEFTLSLNRTTVADGNTQDRFGFGGGVYLRFFNQKRCHLVAGIEYNRNCLFRENVNNGGHWGGGYNDVFNTINNIGFPVSFRVNMGKKAIFFIEAGVFLDLIIFGREKSAGGGVSYIIDSTITNKVFSPFNEIKHYKMPNFGLLGGVGLRIPIQKWEIILKGDYKWGVRDLEQSYRNPVYSRYWRFSAGFKMPFGLKF